MKPRELVQTWVEAFNRADADALAALYSEDAVNHQVAEAPVAGREAIRAMFRSGFERVDMVCIVEHIFEDGDWAILEWRDPAGLRGCGFFRVIGDRIVFQRGYWDKLTFLRLHDLPLRHPERSIVEYLLSPEAERIFASAEAELDRYRPQHEDNGCVLEAARAFLARVPREGGDDRLPAYCPSG